MLGTPVTGDNCGVSSVVNNGSEPYGVGTNVYSTVLAYRTEVEENLAPLS